MQTPINCYIGIGSNLQKPLQQVQKAIGQLSGMADCQLLAYSSRYASTALGDGEQPEFVNAVACLSTTLDAMSLLRSLQALEFRQGRRRTTRWAPRVLDLDILLFGSEQISEPGLEIPHPEMTVRDFVLYPLLEIAPDLRLPDQRPLSELLPRCPDNGLRKIESGAIPIEHHTAN